MGCCREYQSGNPKRRTVEIMTQTTMRNFASNEDRNIACLRWNVKYRYMKRNSCGRNNNTIWGMLSHWPLTVSEAVVHSRKSALTSIRPCLLTSLLILRHVCSSPGLQPWGGPLSSLHSSPLCSHGEITSDLKKWHPISMENGMWICSSMPRTAPDILLYRQLR